MSPAQSDSCVWQTSWLAKQGCILEQKDILNLWNVTFGQWMLYVTGECYSYLYVLFYVCYYACIAVCRHYLIMRPPFITTGTFESQLMLVYWGKGVVFFYLLAWMLCWLRMVVGVKLFVGGGGGLRWLGGGEVGNFELKFCGAHIRKITLC